MWRTLIQPSWRLGTNSLVGRRGRTLLLTAAVGLACSLVVAVSTSMQSVRASIEDELLRTLGAADARIIHLFQGRFDAQVLEQARDWPNVERAIGRYSGALTLVRRDHGIDPETDRPRRTTPLAHGVDLTPEFDVRPIEMVAGSLPAADHEMLVDSIVADRLALEVGDEVEVQRFGEPIFFTVTGIFNRPVLGVLQRPQVIVDRAALERATDRTGQLTDIAIELSDDVDIEQFCAAHIDELPDELSLEPAEMARTGFDRRIDAGDLIFVLLSVFTFLCCSYLILIGMTTGVSERQRELAITRCIGATRAQVFGSQVCIGAIIGGIGALVGVPLGIAFAATLIWFFRDILEAGLQVGFFGIGLAATGALLSGLIGAAVPALLASRVSPLRAVAVRARETKHARVLWLVAVTAIAITIQVLLLLLPESEQVRFWLYITIGLPLMQLGYFALCVPLFVGVVLLLSTPLARLLRLPGNLLRQSALTMPYRLGLTAGALMIGMALLVATWTSTTSFLSDWLGQMRFADGFAYNRNGITPAVRARIEGLPFVRDICPIAYIPLRVQNMHIFGVEGIAPPNVICIGFDPELFFEVNEVEWIVGTPEEAIPHLTSGDGILVAEEFLTTRGLSVGDTLELGAGRVTRPFEIVGVVSAAGLDVATQMFGIRDAYHEHAINCVFADFQTLAEHFDNPDVYLVQINLTDAIDDEAATEEIMAAAPGTLFVSGRSIKRTLDEIGAGILTVNSTVAFAALVLSCVAVGNVLVANVASRQFEYAVIRAVGGTRGHLVRLVYGEAVLLGITAILVGLVFGFHGALTDMRMQQDLIGIRPRFTIQWVAISIGALVLMVSTLIAATPAAHRLVKKSPRELLSAGRGGA